MIRRFALAALSVALVGALIWIAWPREPAARTNDVERATPTAESGDRAGGMEAIDAPPDSAERAPASIFHEDVAPSEPEAATPEPPTVALHGHVRDRDSGAPIAGAVIEFKQHVATTGADGSFRLEKLVAGPSFPQLTVRADGYPTAKELVSFGDSADKELEIQLARGNITLHVVVVDRNTGERVVDPQLSSPSRVVIGEADTDGRFPLSVTEGDDIELKVTADGYCGFSWRWRVARVDSNDRVTIPLLRTASIEGAVRNASQQPVAGADIFVMCATLKSGGVPLSSQERSRFGVRGDASHMLSVKGYPTDENGRFRILAMPCEGDTEISVFASAYLPQKRVLSVRDAGSTVLADFTLERGATIRGRALKNGAQWKGWISSECREAEYRDEPAIQDGEFVFTGVPRGDIVIKLVRAGTKFLEREATVRVTDDGEYRQDFEWTEELSTIAGRVVNPAGQPVPGARVDVHAVLPNGGEITAATASASDGAFAIEVVAGVRYDVAAMHNKVLSVRATRKDIAAGSKDVEIVLPDFGRIRLKLIDDETGELARMSKANTLFALSWRASGTGPFSSYPGFRGRESDITLELPTGAIDLVVNLQVEGFLPWRLSSYRLAAGETQELEARLARGVEARIELVASADEPQSKLAKHVFFCVEESQHELVQGPFADDDERSNHRIHGIDMWLSDPALLHQVLSLDEAGVAFLHGLAPGKYALRAFPPDFEIEPAFVTISPGAKAELEFRWRSRK